MTPVDVVLQFVRAIHSKALAKITNLMTADHQFTDSLGANVIRVEKSREAWQAYFHVVADYWIEVHEIFSEGPRVVLFGMAGAPYMPDGTLRPENAWSTPGAWRALVRDNGIAQWQVYADN